jgi:hypothetical protein
MNDEITLTAIEQTTEVGYLAEMPSAPPTHAMPGHRNQHEDAVRMRRKGGRTFRM